MNLHNLDGAEIKTVKQKIDNVLRIYYQKYPEEAEAFFEIVKEKRKNLHHQYGHIKGDHAIDRILFEMPESTHNLLVQNLSDDQLTWFKTKEGARWFTKTYKKFALTEV